MDDGRKPATDDALEILLLEHNADDARWIERGLEAAGARFRLRTFDEPKAALDHLRQLLLAGSDRLPDLILVDLHLPGAAARETLAELRFHDVLRRIPTVALAAPLCEGDALEAFDLDAWHCLTKTAELPILADRLRWAIRCCLNRFPHRIGSADPVGRSEVAEALILKFAGARGAEAARQEADASQGWQPTRRQISLWRRRRSA